MKKYILLLVSFQISIISFAQNFNSIDAKWHYNQGIMTGPQVYPVLIESVGQQNILGHTCNNLHITGSACSSFSNYLVYQSNDTVYYFVDSLMGFSMLYDFSAAVGDTYTVYGYNFMGNDSLQMHIDSISTMLINGQSRKQFFASQPGLIHSSLELGSNYIEGIGSNEFLFPQYFGCDPVTFGLRCYQDSVLGLYETGIAPSCDTVYTLGISDLMGTSQIKIGPNPFQNWILISGLISWNNEVRIYDMVGNMVYKSRCGNQELNLEYLAKGVYVFSITDERRTLRKRLIKD